jgi:hypothetical protein
MPAFCMRGMAIIRKHFARLMCTFCLAAVVSRALVAG